MARYIIKEARYTTIEAEKQETTSEHYAHDTNELMAWYGSQVNYPAEVTRIEITIERIYQV